MKHPFVICGFVLVIIYAGFGLYSLTGSPPDDEDLKQLKAEGDRIIVKLEEHKARTGVYPETLDELGIEDLDTDWGEWSYGRHAESFDLGVGDYGRHLFEMWWAPEYKDWVVDT